MSSRRQLRFLLYAISIVASGAGFVTQMLVSGFWSTAFSHDIFYFSVNVAFYFLSLGMGSLLSKRFKHPTVSTLLLIALAISAWTGVTIPILKFVIAHLPPTMQFPEWIFPVLTVAVAGVLSGTVIPITLKIGEQTQSVKLSILFFFDYTAAIFFTLIFTFFLLIPQGYSRTALILSLSCIIALAVLAALAKELKAKSVAWFGLAAALPLLFQLSLTPMAAPRLDDEGEAKVLYSEQSHYQKIVLTEETNDDPYLDIKRQHVLYLDGFVQFSSYDEQTYHFCLANIPVVAAEYAKSPARKVLILGGGDGLAARNLLAVNNIQHIEMVELDPAMIRLAKEHPVFLSYNQNSLANPKVHVTVTDGFTWVANQTEQYDVILIDFPAPKNLTLARLFSAEFYSRVMKLVKPKGIVAIQAGPSFSYEDKSFMTLSKVTSSIKKTMASIGYPAWAYITPRDREAFVLATPNRDFNMTDFAKTVGMYGQVGLGQLCDYQEAWKDPVVEANTLNTLKLSTYMLEWFEQAGRPFFHFHGNHSIFLPE